MEFKLKKNKRKSLYAAICLIVAFVLWTAAICCIDVRPIGPNESNVGFATINKLIHNLTGTHMFLYVVTDWLGLIPFGFVASFAILGLTQWIKRRKLKYVDYSIFVLGGFYVVILAVYFFFEKTVVNYRPVLINGILEASYPSSTTMLTLCVMPTSVMQFNDRIKNVILKKCIVGLIVAFTAFMVIGRLISGVHWFTDIAGGVLLSAGLVMMYRFVSNLNTV